ncbi:MAG: AzlC family ABC transporter permease [Eubacteriales bacterium]|nr:AzlC family ABC transporter permease [Eubacteriales bacterium]
MGAYFFLSLTYGLMMKSNGYSFIYPMFMAMVIYGGSVEFIVADMLLGSFDPLAAFLVAFMVNARHLFYGLAMLSKYRGVGKKKFYLIFAMSDETFAVNSSAVIPRGVDHGWFYFWVSLLDQLSWVLGAMCGGLFGSLIQFDVKGIGFAMTAMFLSIFADNFSKEKNHASSFAGLAASLACLLIFGPDDFLIPSMISILVILTLAKPKLDVFWNAQEDEK